MPENLLFRSIGLTYTVSVYNIENRLESGNSDTGELLAKIVETKLADYEKFRLYVSPLDIEQHMEL